MTFYEAIENLKHALRRGKSAQKEVAARQLLETLGEWDSSDKRPILGWVGKPSVATSGARLCAYNCGGPVTDPYHCPLRKPFPTRKQGGPFRAVFPIPGPGCPWYEEVGE